MNREIKFRAWDKENSCFWYSDSSNGQEGCECLVKNGSLVFRFGIYRPYQANGEVIDAFTTEDFEPDPKDVMQYTGLKDKDGKEIYEGDLLRRPARDNWEKTNFIIQEVFFHDNDAADGHIGWQMNRTHYKGSICGHTGVPSFLPKNTCKMEIIGNIYENPELVK